MSKVEIWDPITVDQAEVTREQSLGKCHLTHSSIWTIITGTLNIHKPITRVTIKSEALNLRFLFHLVSFPSSAPTARRCSSESSSDLVSSDSSARI
jgi:hypothetical protein